MSRRALALRALVAFLATAVILLTVAQLVLPGLAAEEARDEVGRYGRVESVSVSAWPAVRLLWGSAGSLRLRASRLVMTPAQSTALLARASGIERIDAGIAALREGPLELRFVAVRKRGPAIAAEGLTDSHWLRAALPGAGLTLIASERGTVRASVAGSLFGRSGRVVALVRCLHGRLVIEAPGLPGRLTLFSDPRLNLIAIGYSQRGAGGLYRLWVTLRLR